MNPHPILIAESFYLEKSLNIACWQVRPYRISCLLNAVLIPPGSLKSTTPFKSRHSSSHKHQTTKMSSGTVYHNPRDVSRHNPGRNQKTNRRSTPKWERVSSSRRSTVSGLSPVSAVLTAKLDSKHLGPDSSWSLCPTSPTDCTILYETCYCVLEGCT